MTYREEFNSGTLEDFRIRDERKYDNFCKVNDDFILCGKKYRKLQKQWDTALAEHILARQRYKAAKVKELEP